MSFVDMCYLRKTKVWNEALHYERQKTHQVFSVALTPQLREIISRYNDPASPVGAALHAARNALFGEQTGRCERRRAACVAV